MNTFDLEAIDGADSEDAEKSHASRKDSCSVNVPIVNRTMIIWTIAIIILFFIVNSYIIVDAEENLPKKSMKRVIIFSICGSLNSVAGFLVFCLIAILVFPPNIFSTVKFLRDAI